MGFKILAGEKEAVCPAECEQKRIQTQKRMVHLGVRATRRDTDKPLQPPPALERTVSIRGQSAELHAVCRLHTARFHTFMLVQARSNPGLPQSEHGSSSLLVFTSKASPNYLEFAPTCPSRTSRLEIR
ncbi:hypothetical protein CgunFtcFv8_020264 [Champsocephalus gunnari]|uniref:Uncharacterized protein n=1 Tax=Champsocephalus gunnari TaxID=52237 RepID=A0AAN8EDM5_CHAGU|nr:hypothetical protein CgunFtcFv8_020264 [Champsocephalus gunnari]